MRFLSCLRLSILALALICGAGTPEGKTRRKAPAKQTRTVENVRQEQNKIHRRISEASKKINLNDAELKRRMGQLNSLNADIETQSKAVQRLREHVDSIGGAIQLTSDSIASLETDLEDLRLAYAKAMARIQPAAGSLDALNFIFSSRTFSEAWSRVRYLRRFAGWRHSKAMEIENTIDQISARRQRLTGLRHNRDVARRNAEQQQHQLEAKRTESKKLVASLRKEDSRLKRQLQDEQKRAAALDRELDRLIAEEQARMAREEKERKRREAEERKKKNAPQGKNAGGKATASAPGSKSTAPTGSDGPSSAEVAAANAATRTAASTSPAVLSGSFLSNKGKLLFPVSGSYKIVRRFGRQPHPTLQHVTIDNSGIDIETRRGAQARAIFGGTVSAVLQQPGYGWIVMLRHGSYLSIYAGLNGASVKKGQTVKAGQNLGVIASDPLRDVATLHFEIRNERTRLNPTAWVK